MNCHPSRRLIHPTSIYAMRSTAHGLNHQNDMTDNQIAMLDAARPKPTSAITADLIARSAEYLDLLSTGHPAGVVSIASASAHPNHSRSN